MTKLVTITSLLFAGGVLFAFIYKSSFSNNHMPTSMVIKNFLVKSYEFQSAGTFVDNDTNEIHIIYGLIDDALTEKNKQSIVRKLNGARLICHYITGDKVKLTNCSLNNELSLTRFMIDNHFAREDCFVTKNLHGGCKK